MCLIHAESRRVAMSYLQGYLIRGTDSELYYAAEYQSCLHMYVLGYTPGDHAVAAAHVMDFYAQEAVAESEAMREMGEDALDWEG